MSEIFSIQEVLQEKLKSLARNQPYEPSNLVLNIVKSNPLELSDSNELILKYDSDYQSKLKTLEPNDTITVENYDVQIRWDKHEITSIKIQIKQLNYKGKKIGSVDIFFQIDNAGGRLINQRSRNFITRIKKAESAIKFSDIPLASLVNDQDLKDLIKQRKSKIPIVAQMTEEKEELSLDTQSLKLLKKLRKVVNKTDLFNLLVKKGVKDGDSKRTIRHMIFPDQQAKGNKDPLSFNKKVYSRTLVHQLMDEYKN